MNGLKKICSCCTEDTDFSRIVGKIWSSSGISFKFSSTYREDEKLEGSLIRVMESFKKLDGIYPIAIDYTVECRKCSTVLFVGRKDTEQVLPS